MFKRLELSVIRGDLKVVVELKVELLAGFIRLRFFALPTNETFVSNISYIL